MHVDFQSLRAFPQPFWQGLKEQTVLVDPSQIFEHPYCCRGIFRLYLITFSFATRNPLGPNSTLGCLVRGRFYSNTGKVLGSQLRLTSPNYV